MDQYFFTVPIEEMYTICLCVSIHGGHVMRLCLVCWYLFFYMSLYAPVHVYNCDVRGEHLLDFSLLQFTVEIKQSRREIA